MLKRLKLSLILVLTIILCLLAGCSTEIIDDPTALSAATEETIYIPVPEGTGYQIPDTYSPGTLTEKNSKGILDYSNTADGYVMVKYTGSNAKVKVIITGPKGTQYTYDQRLDGQYDTFPLSDGNGTYKFGLYENISGTKYSTALSKSFDVKLKDEFAPFIRSNKYVNYTKDSEVVKKAAELTKNKTATLDKVDAVYDFVVKNFKYDYDLAANVKSGYVPDLDSVLKNKKGICFDYASVMTAMLRSQGVPTQLVFGYAGKAYHSWINVYSEKDGWVTATIYFDGKNWKRMDPTFASTGKSSAEILKYIGDGKNYTAQHLY
ncbi:transglutaminase-like domain-containing protein [Clostridiaceae bacterium OttesenSCG-928-D20]|nr:transglutaminase-like domain-containing protein [Clostridiaceae bacterium OttesenSCG-928-D20]